MLQKITKLILSSALAVLVVSCSSVPDKPLYTPSEALNDYRQNSFAEYLTGTRQWLQQNRVFISGNHQQELEANMPFEIQPAETVTGPRKGILLVHGLGDSPFYFRDIGAALSEQGFLVRTLLIPGHGSRPGNLLLAEYKAWQDAVRHHTRLLQQDVDEVWLGGFSTGANLVTVEAIENDQVSGLLLISPALVPGTALTSLLPVVNLFTDWLDQDPADGNYTRYSSVATNGATQYYYSSRAVRRQLANKLFEKPVLMAMSGDDGVINPVAARELFQERFTHPDSRLLWFGNSEQQSDPRIISFNTDLPAQRISNFSHMSLLFNRENDYYGLNASQRMCDNGQTEAAEQQCRDGAEIWYSVWGHQEADKIHARLTWNPYFELLTDNMQRISSTKQENYAAQ